YRSANWPAGAVPPGVSRDSPTRMGVGGLDRFATPRREYASHVVARGDRLEMQVEIERVEKFLRDYRLVREPMAAGPSADRADVPVCRFVVIGADGTVAAAGVGGEAQGDKLVVGLGGRVKPGAYTAMVALSLGDALENAEVTAVPLRVAARSDATGSSARAALSAR